MKSSNIEEFNLLVDEYLKQDSRYERQIRNFQSFLKEYGLEDKVFNLYEDNINDFFEYAVEHNIGTDAQLSIHIAALNEDLLHQFEKVSGQEFANDKALLS